MTKLRQDIIRPMELRDLSDNPQRAYLQAVSGLAMHYMTSPDQVSKEMIEDYLLHLKNTKGCASNTYFKNINFLLFTNSCEKSYESLRTFVGIDPSIF